MNEPPAEQPPEKVRPEPAPTPEEMAADAELESLIQRAAILAHRGRGGANWFFWVAGLSVVNSILFQIGAPISFIFGLGVTLFADLIGADLVQQGRADRAVVTVAVLAFNTAISLCTAAFGWMANRRLPGMFILGMLLYLCDGLVSLYYRDFFAAGFHVLALFWMWQGYNAYRELAKVEAELDRRLPAGATPELRPPPEHEPDRSDG